jgi:hypothetical protein
LDTSVVFSQTDGTSGESNADPIVAIGKVNTAQKCHHAFQLLMIFAAYVDRIIHLK